jgi:hypothetical protein
LSDVSSRIKAIPQDVERMFTVFMLQPPLEGEGASVSLPGWMETVAWIAPLISINSSSDNNDNKKNHAR